MRYGSYAAWRRANPRDATAELGDGVLRRWDLRARDGEDLGRWTAVTPTEAVEAMARGEGYANYKEWRRANRRGAPVELTEVEAPRA